MVPGQRVHLPGTSRRCTQLLRLLQCLDTCSPVQGFLSSEETRARGYFERARDCFQKALDEVRSKLLLRPYSGFSPTAVHLQDPGSEVYQKALEMTSKAPAMYAELQRQLAGGQVGIRTAAPALLTELGLNSGCKRRSAWEGAVAVAEAEVLAAWVVLQHQRLPAMAGALPRCSASLQ